MSGKPVPPHRFMLDTPSLKSWGEIPRTADGQKIPSDVVLDCGWGRLIFGHTFRDPERLADTLRNEQPGQRDIALYLREPHVLLAMGPQELFLDPSHTYRLQLPNYRPARSSPPAVHVQRPERRQDFLEMERIYRSRQMVPPPPEFVANHHNSRCFTYLIAKDESGAVLGTVTGVDHVHAFDDPENGCSLWCLAVDPKTTAPGVGELLVRRLAEHYQGRGRAFMDLSVMHDNEQAIALYEKLGFQRVPVFCMKTKNVINQSLYSGPEPDEELNPYAMIIINEARRRGIAVEILDTEAAYFRLTFGGRSLVCRESLSELTSAVAMSRCDDKAVTRRVLADAGLRVPEQIIATGGDEDAEFLEKHGRVVVKPARGEQGHGVHVDVRTREALESVVDSLSAQGGEVLIEELVRGMDLRIVVIDFKVVAAALRSPPVIVGTGQHTIRELIAKLSRRRAAATGGESKIPLDDETIRNIQEAGYELDSELPSGAELVVRKTANLHTGGTIHDVTPRLHPELAHAAERAAEALNIPVTGLDLIVEAEDAPSYAIIEANERPGLANHEPQPTAERFVDFLFPLTKRLSELS